MGKDVGFGYVPDTPESTDRGADEILSRIEPLEKVNLDWTVIEVLDQGKTSTCTVQAINQAGRCTNVINGEKAPPLWNRCVPYYDGRDDTSIDVGAQPRRIFGAYWLYGYCLDSLWPFTPDKVFRRPPPRLRSQSYPQVGKLGFLRTSDDGGAKRVDQIKRALSGMFFVTLALSVDEAFIHYKGGTWTKTGAEVGRHYVCVVGYDAEGIWVVNSWGMWGLPDSNGRFQGGFGRIGWDMVEDPALCTDAYVITLAPEVVQ